MTRAVATLDTPRQRRDRWRSHGFGLAIDGGFPLAGCRPSTVPAGLRRVQMDLAPRPALATALSHDGTTVITDQHDPSGHRTLKVLAHPTDGYLIDCPGFGLFHLSSGGTQLRCAPRAGVAPWRWQRYLIGQVLPFTSALRGLEPLHASAVALDGLTIAVVGASGQGKSTLAAELLLEGAVLVADDVLAVEARGSHVVGYPAPGLITVRHVTSQRLGTGRLGQLGQRVGQNANGIRLAVRRCEQPLRLAAVYHLERGDPHSPARLEPAQMPARLLLSNTFVSVLRTPDRLARLLDVCTGIAASCAVVRVSLPADTDFPAIAQEVLAHAANVAGDRPQAR